MSTSEVWVLQGVLMIKKIILILLIIVSLLVFLSVWAYQNKVKHMNEDPFFKEINTLESQQRFDELNQKLIEKATMGRYEFKDKLESRWMTDWLKSRLTSSEIPTLYLIAKFYENYGEFKKSSEWYAIAALTARVDAVRCTDPSASQSIIVMESIFKWTKQYSQSHPQEKAKIFQKSLDYEESAKNRPMNQWICAHGIKSFRQSPQSKPDTEWHEQREKIRREFLNTLKKVN